MGFASLYRSYDLAICGAVIACDKREAFAHGREATKQSILSFRCRMDCFASLAMTWKALCLYVPQNVCSTRCSGSGGSV